MHLKAPHYARRLTYASPDALSVVWPGHSSEPPAEEMYSAEAAAQNCGVALFSFDGSTIYQLSYYAIMFIIYHVAIAYTSSRPPRASMFAVVSRPFAHLVARPLLSPWFVAYSLIHW